MFKKVLSKLSGLNYRFELIKECERLRKAGKYLPQNYKKLIFKSPGRYDDFINILCFIDNKKETSLVDIGANKGEFSKDFLNFFPKTKEIVLFEPLKHLNEKIKINLNGYNNYKIINSGVGDKEEIRIFKYDKDFTDLGSFKDYADDVNTFYKKKGKVEENIEITKLDNLNFDFTNQSVLKVDVQGFELEVLKGALNSLVKFDLIIIECSFVSEYLETEPSFSEIVKILRINNFFPLIFQNYTKSISNYAFERDVIFVKKNLLNKIFYKNY
jgi:FkbM family methyltransferase